jgi:hypothetical protein
MATNVRNLDGAIERANLVVLNALRLDLMKLKSGSIFHADASTAISAATASDLPTVITLANAVKASYNLHIASVCSATTGQGAHLSVDAANGISSADATDQGTANTLLNEIKTDYNVHRASAVFHHTADATNVIAAANASDLGTSITLANELKTDINLHYAAAFASQAVALVSA